MIQSARIYRGGLNVNCFFWTKTLFFPLTSVIARTRPKRKRLSEWPEGYHVLTGRRWFVTNATDTIGIVSVIMYP